jgi:hypothetical protein
MTPRRSIKPLRWFDSVRALNSGAFSAVRVELCRQFHTCAASRSRGGRGKGSPPSVASRTKPIPYRGSVRPITEPNHANGPVHGSRDRARARTSWPRCGAYARSSGEPCRAEGSGINGLCPRHCGLVLPSGWRDPKPTWELLVGSRAVLLKPSRPGHGRWPAEREAFEKRWPQRIRPWIAVRLVAGGQVKRAMILRGSGARLLKAILAKGVRVIPERVHPYLASGISLVRFEAGGVQP